MDAIVDPDMPDYGSSPWGSWGRTFTLGVVSLFGKTVMHVLNSTTIIDESKIHDAVMHRPEGVGLITVCNHTSTMDDPALVSSLVPWRYFLQESKYKGIRWTFCAHDVCFKNEFLRQFFVSGKTLPIKRGAGVNQPVMLKVAEYVRDGDWLHIFPEGKVSHSGKLQTLKWGVGKMICDSLQENGTAPMIVPFFHTGMGEVMPKGSIVPKSGKQVVVKIGDTVNLDDLTCQCNKQGENPKEVWKDITKRIQEKMLELEKQCPENVDQIKKAGKQA